jgi:hypothetical protein
MTTRGLRLALHLDGHFGRLTCCMLSCHQNEHPRSEEAHQTWHCRCSAGNIVHLKRWQGAGDAKWARAACHLKHPQRLQSPLELRIRAEVHLCSHKDESVPSVHQRICFIVMYDSNSALSF